MRFLIQYVQSASVFLPNKDETRSIGRGVLVYMGIHKDDIHHYPAQIQKFIKKIQTVQMLTGKTDKIDASLHDIQGQILLISNFTLYSRNNKWSWIDYTHSATRTQAQQIYDYCREQMTKAQLDFQTWSFGDKMHITSTLHGPINHIREF